MTRPITPPASAPENGAPDVPPLSASRAAVRDAVRRAVEGLDATAPWPEFTRLLVRVGREHAPAPAKLIESHLDALRIADELGHEPTPGALYAVWASKSEGTGLCGEPVDAGRRADSVQVEGSWELAGTLRFASGADICDRALVTVALRRREDELTGPRDAGGGDTQPAQLLDVDLEGDALRRHAHATWHTAAMRGTGTTDILLPASDAIRCRATPVGQAGAYLDRWGFLPGGAGVSCVWAGGIERLATLCAEAIGAPSSAPRPGKRQRLGAIRLEAATAAALCRDTAEQFAAPDVANDRAAAGLVAARCRAGVAAAALRAVAHARVPAGPAALTRNAALIEQITDLELYVAQHDTDSALEALGDPAS